MKKLFALLSTLALAAPAGATVRPVDNGLMVNDPMFGPSRFETVAYCLNDAGVDRYQDLITDSHFDTYEACMIEHT
jgi:hypothetical protein